MKNMLLVLGCVMANVALTITTVASNSACRLVIYQPKLPAEADKLKKF